MRGYLLDTNVLSLLSPSQTAPDGFTDWLAAEDEASRIFLSSVTIHEVEKGIGLLDHRGADAKADALRAWLSGLVRTYEDKLLPFDIAVAAISGQLEAFAVASGHSPGMADAMIAGTAKTHELTVVTRNGKHFEPFGIPWLLPEACKLSR